MSRMNNDLISRKAIYKAISDYLNRSRLGETSAQTDLRVGEIASIIHGVPTAFNKEKVIEELKSWEKASHDAGIQSTYAELDNKASGYYQESRAYHRAVEIVEKGGIE